MSDNGPMTDTPTPRPEKTVVAEADLEAADAADAAVIAEALADLLEAHLEAVPSTGGDR